jgi:molybdopterin-binding protein
MAQGQRLAHRIGVMMDGKLIQVGKPGDIFYTPSDLRVAHFVGVENIFKVRITANEGGLAHISVNGHSLEAVTEHHTGEEVHAFIRPEEVTISLQPASTSARNAFSGEVRLVALSGPLARVEIDCGIRLVALVTRRSAEELGLQMGQSVHASFKATAVHVISRADSAQAEPPGTVAESSAANRDTDSFKPPGRHFWWSGG